MIWGSVEPLLFSSFNFIMIRRAELKDIDKILDLLKQVCLVHHNGRPDIFNIGTKYNYDELKELIYDDNNPIFVYDDGGVLGYAFCNIIENNGHVLTNIKTLYIDDLCVDKNARGKGIGKALYQYVKEFAKENKIYNITLNVWDCNPNAKKFYESLGLKPMKTYLEEII